MKVFQLQPVQPRPVVAKALECETIALRGTSGEYLALLSAPVIRVPADGVAEIQGFYLPSFYAFCIDLEGAFFSS